MLGTASIKKGMYFSSLLTIPVLNTLHLPGGLGGDQYLINTLAVTQNLRGKPLS
tara:strand:- start:204 stop:365 length:162 start_codon:yes stop_codon:yes gene_type:complete